MKEFLDVAIGVVLFFGLIIGGLKFLSYVVTGEWRLFPKD